MASTSVSLDLGRTLRDLRLDQMKPHCCVGGWTGRDAETNADGGQKENSTVLQNEKNQWKGVFFFSLISSQCCKKRIIPFFWQVNLTSSFASYDIWGKIGPWWGCRHHEWKINTFNLHAEIAEKKKKHNIMLIIDKDIQFQYHRRACCHDNVISRVFNPQVARRPLRSPSIWCGSPLSDSLSLWFYQPLV